MKEVKGRISKGMQIINDFIARIEKPLSMCLLLPLALCSLKMEAEAKIQKKFCHALGNYADFNALSDWKCKSEPKLFGQRG